MGKVTLLIDEGLVEQFKEVLSYEIADEVSNEAVEAAIEDWMTFQIAEANI